MLFRSYFKEVDVTTPKIRGQNPKIGGPDCSSFNIGVKFHEIEIEICKMMKECQILLVNVIKKQLGHIICYIIPCR